MDTFVSVLTPPGKGAIATIAVRGEQAWSITRTLFLPKRGALPDVPSVGRFWFGRLGADEVIVAVKQVGVEVHCHGGVEVVRMIQGLYIERGAVLVPWQHLFGESAPLIELLTRAPTLRTAGILLDQVNGAWERVGPKDTQRLEQLVPLGQHLVEPWKVVIAGAPNVGKSSLMNALTGFTRSIVAPTPGTTRDVVSARIAIDGWPIELIDTAGIRETTSDLERQGIERAQAALADADLRFWVLDGSMKPEFLPSPPGRGAGGEGWHYLINKIDLPPAWDWRSVAGAQRISAETRSGMAELCEMISRTLVPAPPAPGDAVPCLPEHVATLR